VSKQIKEQHVHAVFQNVAPKYDVMNDVLSFRQHKVWRKFTMKKMNVSKGQTAVDLCCGTCDWTISLAKASQTGTITGLDFSENMLEYGRRKVVQAGLLDRIKLDQGNAMELPYADNSFDYATIGFGLRNVPDLVKVLSEMKRVVKPGGSVVCLELSKPVWQPFKGIYYFYFNYMLPLVAKVLAKRYDQYKWLPESLALFPDHKQLANIFREIDLQDVKVYPLSLGIAALHIGVKGRESIHEEA
jgi:demethylmenaquinone methyltransferase/2-methoxy-6-polyprenyl-1,4-benzoquinol methylase